jgi:hypothetical protein
VNRVLSGLLNGAKSTASLPTDLRGITWAIPIRAHAILAQPGGESADMVNAPAFPGILGSERSPTQHATSDSLPPIYAHAFSRADRDGSALRLPAKASGYGKISMWIRRTAAMLWSSIGISSSGLYIFNLSGPIPSPMTTAASAVPS